MEGSGRYLNDQKTSARAVRSSLLYNIKTKEENVNIYHESVRDAFSIDSIKNGLATHVVVGISWGANSVLTCEYQNRNNRDVTEIQGSLSASLKKLSLSISGKASVEFNEADSGESIRFDIKVFGDVLPRNEDLPTTFEGALNFMKQMPSLLATSNQGRGKPLMYQLLPISLLRDYLQFSIKGVMVLKTLEDACLLRIVQLFEQLSKVNQKINDLHKDAFEYKYSLLPDDMSRILNLKKELTIQEAKLRSKLAETLKLVRSGEADVSQLEDIIAEYMTNDYFTENIFTTWGLVVEKIKCAKALVDNGAIYIGIGTSLDDELLKDFEKRSFVLYFTQSSKMMNNWKGNRQLFFQEMKKKSGAKYYAVDCDIHSELWTRGTSFIEVVESGKLIIEDLLIAQQENEINPLAQSLIGVEQILHKPNKRARLSINCTGKNCDSSKIYDWLCTRCKLPLEFGFDQFVYCSCGRSPANQLEFKCTDPCHGVAFERHVEGYFQQLLGTLRPFKEMNILILGETGVGKSTWINGFINFLTFDSLKEAEENDLHTLIPSEFTVCDEFFNEIIVSTGTSDNEVHKPGQSATQGCKVYPFQVGDVTIRLIDTPGIGDTRGVDQDKRNFQNILNTLSYLDELHGICILLKPNNARLTLMFRFCIKELLTYLHRDASHNIVFCFTNSRGTFYRPGDTMPPLKALLAENKDVSIPISMQTVYCYDSEAYRFLAAVKNTKNPITFPNDERENFTKSWDKSVSETKRMLKHIGALQPHPIKDTLNLNHTRELVIKLTRPLAEISKMIQTNKKIVKDELNLIQQTKDSIKELEKVKMRTKIELETVPLDYPKTVCTDVNCKKIYGPKEAMMVKYTTVCHDHCGLPGVARDTIGDPGLMQCWAMINGFCRHSSCGHHYNLHMHIYYDTEEVIKEVEDEIVKDSLLQKLSATEIKQKMITARNVEIQELDYELKEIEKASVQFACFLKKNAITPYNDAMLEFMDHLIKEEKDKIAAGGDRKTLEAMELSKMSYKHEISILQGQMDKGDGVCVLKPADVEERVGHLYKLKHNGKHIENALKYSTQTGYAAAVYREVVLPYKPAKKSSGRNFVKRGWNWITGQ